MDLHVFSDDEEMVVAANEADARAVMRELGGPDVWPDEVEIEQMPDERPITIVDDENGEVRKTCGEWATEKGRGYLCGPCPSSAGPTVDVCNSIVARDDGCSP